MSHFLPKTVRDLIDEMARLPGIGPKSAQRIAMHLLHSPESKIESLGNAVLNLKENLVFCENCWNIAESNPCKICTDEQRDRNVICVVEDILDAQAIEKTREYKGLYHVLHGALSPIDGIGPDQLKLQDLFKRIEANDSGIHDENSKISEIILATNPSLEGETTALYIQKHLLSFDLKITRIARGLPVGGDLEYADEVTLSRAMTGRGEFGGGVFSA
ncbi:MAG: recombination mediator RecR [Candidatus Gracilibacteria bacterium]|nr:recombination mediator RecR [Candidatus Gracilibacteria bacterium]